MKLDSSDAFTSYLEGLSSNRFLSFPSGGFSPTPPEELAAKITEWFLHQNLDTGCAFTEYDEMAVDPRNVRIDARYNLVALANYLIENND